MEFFNKIGSKQTFAAGHPNDFSADRGDMRHIPIKGGFLRFPGASIVGLATAFIDFELAMQFFSQRKLP